MKKLAVLLCLSAIMLMCFSACNGEAYPLSADGESIPAGVYAYYLSETKDTDEALNMCLNYVAAAKLMKDEGITLSANYKRLVADDTDSKWNLFSAYYESIGVSKQDITQALIGRYNKMELLDYYYGENGKSPVSDDKIESKFDKTYVGFKAIEASYLKLSDMGDSVSLSEGEKKSLKNRFQSMAKSINSGAMTINEANESYNQSIGIIVTQNLETALMKQGDVLYSDDFFSQVSQLKKGEAAVVESLSSIFLVQRQSITSEDDGYVFIYRSEILENMKMPDVEKKISQTAETIDLKINKRLTNDIAELVFSE